IGTAGAGKSVLAKILCGLIAPDAGTARIEFRSAALGGVGSAARGGAASPIGMLFQNNALFDSMTVGDNVAFPLAQRATLPADEIRARVSERLRAVGLAGSEAQFPNQLS